jgi:transposase
MKIPEVDGRLSTSTDDVHINAFRHLILQNRRLTIREIAEDLRISFGTSQAILTEKLNMQRVAAKLVPCVLTDDHKAKHVNISQELLYRVSVDENFLKNIVTGDETWVYGYDVKTKSQSSQWLGQVSPRRKKARMSRSNMKVMLVFFDWQGIIHHEFVPRCQAVNKEFYIAVLKRLREAVRRKKPQFWKNQSWVLNHDNAPAHSSFLVRHFLAKNETTVVPQPSYSLDLAPADFFLFPKLKSTLKGRRFNTVDEILKHSTNKLFAIPKETFQKAFQSWQKR